MGHKLVSLDHVIETRVTYLGFSVLRAASLLFNSCRWASVIFNLWLIACAPCAITHTASCLLIGRRWVLIDCGSYLDPEDWVLSAKARRRTAVFQCLPHQFQFAYNA